MPIHSLPPWFQFLDISQQPLLQIIDYLNMNNYFFFMIISLFNSSLAISSTFWGLPQSILNVCPLFSSAIVFYPWWNNIEIICDGDLSGFLDIDLIKYCFLFLQIEQNSPITPQTSGSFMSHLSRRKSIQKYFTEISHDMREIDEKELNFKCYTP